MSMSFAQELASVMPSGWSAQAAGGERTTRVGGTSFGDRDRARERDRSRRGDGVCDDASSVIKTGDRGLAGSSFVGSVGASGFGSVNGDVTAADGECRRDRPSLMLRTRDLSCASDGASSYSSRGIGFDDDDIDISSLMVDAVPLLSSSLR